MTGVHTMHRSRFSWGAWRAFCLFAMGFAARPRDRGTRSQPICLEGFAPERIRLHARCDLEVPAADAGASAERRSRADRNHHRHGHERGGALQPAELEGSLTFEPDKPLPGDNYPDEFQKEPQTGHSCGSSPFPGCYAESGPYRRIFTTPVLPEKTCPSGVTRPCPEGYTNQGYWITGHATIGCKAGTSRTRGHFRTWGTSTWAGGAPSPPRTGA